MERFDESLLWQAPNRKPEQMSSLTLAYIGDAVFELWIRQHLVHSGNHRPKVLHQSASRYVSAAAQAKALQAWSPLLTEEESGVVRKGRNARSGTVPKNASVIDYRRSTAFEALIGYLYCQRRFDRLEELLVIALESLNPTHPEKGGVNDGTK